MDKYTKEMKEQVEKLLEELREIAKYTEFDNQKAYTKNALRGAIDKLKEFIDNIGNDFEE